MSETPMSNPVTLVPFSFDLSSLVQRSVAALYSNLVTRPTGQALRLGIESQIGEIGSRCLSILDFSQVAVLDYSCADEAVAKLIQRYIEPDRSADAYFLARGVAEQHRDPIEAVLARHGLSLVAELGPRDFALLGAASADERTVWAGLQQLGFAAPAALAGAIGAPEADVLHSLNRLAERRVVLRCDVPRSYYALSRLLATA